VSARMVCWTATLAIAAGAVVSVDGGRGGFAANATLEEKVRTAPISRTINFMKFPFRYASNEIRLPMARTQRTATADPAPDANADSFPIHSQFMPNG
jgi:hypothetical protein